MEVIVDAHLLGWYYQAGELQKETPCSASPIELFERLGRGDIGVLDSDGHIEAEWREHADPDWFDAWLSERFEVGDIIEVAVENYHRLIQGLVKKCGFPATGKDKWYIRASKSRAVAVCQPVALISEDLDFYEPKAKKGAGDRDAILAQGSGAVAKQLRKEGVDPRTAARHLALEAA